MIAERCTDGAVNGPAGTAVLHGGTVGIQSQMANLDFAGFIAVIYLPFNHEPAANAAAHVHIKGGIESAACTSKGFTEGCSVGIVFDDDR